VINSPAELFAELVKIFPAFCDQWDGGEAFGYENGGFSYHSIMLTFGPRSKKLFAQASPDQLKRLCAFIDSAVAQGGAIENAVSTCFLEHATQIGIRSYIRPYLSPKARCNLR